MRVKMGDKGHGQKLSRHGARVLAALLQYPTVTEAAKASGIAESSIFRWLQRTDFMEQYRAAQRAVVDKAVGELQGATKEAVATLRRNLSCGNASVEVRAAQIILEQSFKAIEIQELQERLERLEAMLNPPMKQMKQRNRRA
jgi:hypothetical protein